MPPVPPARSHVRKLVNIRSGTMDPVAATVDRSPDGTSEGHKPADPLAAALDYIAQCRKRNPVGLGKSDPCLSTFNSISDSSLLPFDNGRPSRLPSWALQ